MAPDTSPRTYDLPPQEHFDYQHVMVDIETFDTKPSSVILSVAAVEFDPLGVAPSRPILHVYLNKESQLAEGRTQSADTIVWWSKQSRQAQMRMLEGQEVSVRDLDIAREMITPITHYRNIWANGPDFDCTILRDFMGYGYSWPFWKHRCVRTLKAMFPDAVAGIERGVAHDALEDCHFQIKQIQAAHGRALTTPPTTLMFN